MRDFEKAARTPPRLSKGLSIGGGHRGDVATATARPGIAPGTDDLAGMTPPGAAR